jgi:hypothetical protein
MLKTKTDDPAGWLAAGRMRARVELQSRATGAAVSVFARELREAGVREELRTEVGRKGYVQAVLRYPAVTLRLDSEGRPSGPVTQSSRGAYAVDAL